MVIVLVDPTVAACGSLVDRTNNLCAVTGMTVHSFNHNGIERFGQYIVPGVDAIGIVVLLIPTMLMDTIKVFLMQRPNGRWNRRSSIKRKRFGNMRLMVLMMSTLIIQLEP